jgi:hypothetical protein
MPGLGQPFQAGGVTDPAASQGGAAGVDAMGAYLAITAASTLYGTFAQHRAGRLQREIQAYNAQVADYQAKDALERGVIAETRSRTTTKRTIGAQRAFFASQGVDVNEGSPADVQANTAYLGELDALTIRNNAAREAWGYRAQAVDYSRRGAVAGFSGDMAATGTLLTGSSRLLLAKYGFGRSQFATDPLI